MAQGEGEACCTAIEAPLTVTMRFDVRRDLRIAELQYQLPPGAPSDGTPGYYVTTGHGEDLRGCARDAVRHMVDWLERMQGLSRDQPYCVASVAGDLRISQAVTSNRVVSFSLPLSVIAKGGR